MSTPSQRHKDSLRIAIIGGSGLGEALRDGMNPEDVETHDCNTPFGKPSGAVTTGRYGEVEIALLQRHGKGHLLNPSNVPYRANIFALKSLGCTHVIASGATGSLREEIVPGELVVCDQLIDRTVNRPRTFYEDVAVHVEFAEPFCPVMRQWLIDASKNTDETPVLPKSRVHERGTYVCMEGPSFSTRAESHLHRQWGADVIGMTALPEARLAREAELPYALLALPTDYDCWRPHKGDSVPLLHEIIGNLKRTVAASIELIKVGLEDVSVLVETPSPACDALKLGIWSDKSMVEPSEVKRLEVLWGRHFT